MKRAAHISIALLFGLTLFFTALEVTLRTVNIFANHPLDLNIEMAKYATQLKRVAADPAISHEHIPSQSAVLMGVEVNINAHKLRDRELTFAKPAGESRVLMLGDSLTLGWGVPFAETTSELLERRLKGVEVINSGVGNYNTAMEVAYFMNEGWRFNPDLIVLNFFINDAEPTPNHSANFFLEHSTALIFLYSRWDVLARQWFKKPNYKAFYKDLYKPGSPGLVAMQDAIKRLAGWSHANGVPLLIVYYPELHNLEDNSFAKAAKLLKNMALSQKVSFLDLTSTVKGLTSNTLWVSPNDPHPNGVANRHYVAALHLKISAILARVRGFG